MRFLRHLAAVLLVVGIIVAAALAWGHGSTGGIRAPAGNPGTLIIAGSGKHVAVHGPAGQPLRALGSGPGPSLSNAGDLIRKSAAEVAVIVVVALLSSVYQRRRRTARHQS